MAINIGKAKKLTSGLTSRIPSLGKPAMAAIALGGFAAGVSNKAGPAVVDATSDAVLGDPNADKYFMGEQGFSIGGLAQAKLFSNSDVAFAGSVAGGVAGTVAGAAVGAGATYLGKEFLKDINIPSVIPESIPLIGGKKMPKSILKPGMHSGKVGGLALAGAAIGGAIGATSYIRHYARDNKEFMQSNPFSRGSAMQASATGAYGDIVLGMHNTRRG